MSIGIFDSGLGGLTVLKEIIQKFPEQDIIYFGDTARLPYGDKSPDTIVRFAIENATFLNSFGIQTLIVGCNSVSAYAINPLRKRFSFPIIDVVEPAVKCVQSKKIAVLGTKATIRSGIYQSKIQEKIPGAEVTSVACPLFVPLVEENFLSHPATKMIIQEYLRPVKEKGVDTVILGCTHYPLLASMIQEELGEGVNLLSSASACAGEVANHLPKVKSSLSEKGIRKYYVSDDPIKFQKMGQQFLGVPIQEVKLVP